MDRPTLRAAEVAELLGYRSRNPVYLLARDGRLPCVRIGRAVRFRHQDVDAFIRSGGDARPLPRSKAEERGARAPEPEPALQARPQVKTRDGV